MPAVPQVSQVPVPQQHQVEPLRPSSCRRVSIASNLGKLWVGPCRHVESSLPLQGLLDWLRRTEGYPWIILTRPPLGS
jgi:hypothetical protein